MEFCRSKSWLWIVAIAAALAGIIFAAGWNVPLFLMIHHAGAHLPNVFWESVTICGNGLVSMVLLTWWLRKRLYAAWAGLLAAIPAAIISRTFKMAIDVPRPPAVLSDAVLHVIGPAYRHTSFPSGDALTIFVIAGLAWFIYNNRLVRTTILAFATLVAVSRIVVGVHWPIDALAGAAAGLISAWIGVSMAVRWPWGATSSGRRFTAGFLFIAAIALFYQDTRLPNATWLRVLIAATGVIFSVWSLIRPQRLLDQDNLAAKRKPVSSVMIMGR